MRWISGFLGASAERSERSKLHASWRVVAWYPFDGNASDMSGNGNHGTVNGATLTTNRHGQANMAYSFDGTSWIEAPHSELINFSQNEVLLSHCGARLIILYPHLVMMIPSINMLIVSLGFRWDYSSSSPSDNF